MTTSAIQPDPKFAECRTRCTYAFATATIFQKRAKKYTNYMRLLTFLGLALPLALGGVVAADLVNKELLSKFIWLAGAIGVIQLVVSLWSVVAHWPENLESSLSAGSENTRLADEFDVLAKQVLNPPMHFDAEYAKLKALDDAQRRADERQFISDRERIYGHRSALREYQSKCRECNEIPQSRKIPMFVKNRCGVCGGPKK